MTDEELLALLNGESAPSPNAAPVSDEDLLASLEGGVTAKPPAATIDQPSGLDKARHVLSGGVTDFVTATLDAPYNIRKLLERGASAATGSEVDLTLPEAANYFAPTALINTPFSERPGIRDVVEVTGREMVDPEQNPGIDAMRTGVEWAAGAPIAAASKLSMVPDLLMGGGAAIGDYLQSDKESPFGEVAGGISGLLASLLRGKAGVGITKAEEKARKFIEQNIQDPDAAKKALEKYTREGSTEAGTLADVTGDRGVFNVEAGAARDPRFGSQVKDIDVARQQQIADELRKPFGEGTPQQAQNIANEAVARASARVKERTTRVGDASDQVVSQGQDAANIARLENQAGLEQSRAAAAQGKLDAQVAQEGADAAALPLSTGQRPAQASTRLAVTQRQAADDFNTQKVRPKWDAFDESAEVNVIPIVKEAKEYIDNLTPTAKKLLVGKYGSTLRIADWKEGVAHPTEVTDFIQAAKNNIEEAEKFGRQEHYLQEVVDIFEEQLIKTNPLYEAAVSATNEMNKRFFPGKVGKAMRRSEPETFASDLGFANEGGAVTARYLLQEAQVPANAPAVIQYLKTQVPKGGVDDAFVNKYGDVLDALPPSVRSEFQASIDATGVAETAAANAVDLGKATNKVEAATAKANEQVAKGETKLVQAAAANRKAALKRERGLKETIDKTWIGKYAMNPDAALKSLLKPGQGKALGELYQSMVKRGEGKAFKAALGERVRLALAEGSNTETKVLPSSRGKFKAIRDTLEESEVLSKAEIDNIAESLGKTKSVELRGKSWAENANQLESEMDNLAASAVAAVALKALPGSSLVLAGAVRRIAKKAIPGLTGGNAKEMAALEKFLTNPQVYFEAAKGAKTSTEAVRKILTKAFGASLAAQAMNEEENN